VLPGKRLVLQAFFLVRDVHESVISSHLKFAPVQMDPFSSTRDAVSALEPFDLEASLRQTSFLFAGKVTTTDALEVGDRTA
jgi:hypothetical protein